MKKSIFLSSVVAVAVVGMLSFSGCGGNGGSKKNPNTFNPQDFSNAKSKKVGAVITVGGDSEEKSGAMVVGGHEKNKYTFSLKNIKGTKGCDANNSNPGCNKTCDEAAQVGDPCKVETERKCAADGEKLDYKSASIKSAFDALDSSGIKADQGKDYRYAGFLNVFTKDDINDGKLYIKADLDCSLGRDNRGIYINGTTAKENSTVVVIITAKDKDGNEIKRKVFGKLKYRDHNGTPSGAYVDFTGTNGIDISDIYKDKELKLSFFVEEENVIADPNDVWSGATGGTASGAGS